MEFSLKTASSKGSITFSRLGAIEGKIIYDLPNNTMTFKVNDNDMLDLDYDANRVKVYDGFDFVAGNSVFIVDGTNGDVDCHDITSNDITCHDINSNILLTTRINTTAGLPIYYGATKKFEILSSQNFCYNNLNLQGFSALQSVTYTTPKIAMGVYDAYLGNPYIQLNSQTNGDNNIYFTDQSGSYGFLKYNHTSDILNSYMLFAVNTLPRLYLRQTEADFTNLNILTTGFVGIGSGIPTSSLSVFGSHTSTNQDYAGIFAGIQSDSNVVVEIVAGSTKASIIDFTRVGSSSKGRIIYNHTGDSFDIRTNNISQMSITDNVIDCTDCKITTIGYVGIGTTTPESALHITGVRASTPTTYGVHIGSAGSNVFGMEICSNTGDSTIDFTTLNENYRGRILYSNSANRFDFRTNGSITQMSISNNVIDCTDCDVSTTGTVTATTVSATTYQGNLNSIKGQLCSYHGEENAQLTAGSYAFRMGNGASTQSRFGMLIPFNFKVKKFCYASDASTGSAYTTSTVIVFRAYSDNVALDLYAYCDFSFVSADVTNRRISNKFSSSPTSQVDTEMTFSNVKGTSLAWYCYSLAGYNTNNTKHRFSIVVETTEDL
jgi:hypothetical protein